MSILFKNDGFVKSAKTVMPTVGLLDRIPIVLDLNGKAVV